MYSFWNLLQYTIRGTPLSLLPVRKTSTPGEEKTQLRYG
jgi:hypothetical protein